MTKQQVLNRLVQISSEIIKKTNGSNLDFMRIIPLLIRGISPFEPESLAIAQVDLKEWNDLLSKARRV